MNASDRKFLIDWIENPNKHGRSIQNMSACNRVSACEFGCSPIEAKDFDGLVKSMRAMYPAQNKIAANKVKVIIRRR